MARRDDESMRNHIQGMLNHWPEDLTIAPFAESSAPDRDADGADWHPHLHYDWELKFYAGRSKNVCEDMGLKIHPPTVVLIPPNTVHSSTSPDKIRNCALLTICFEPDNVRLSHERIGPCEFHFWTRRQKNFLNQLCLGGFDRLLTTVVEGVTAPVQRRDLGYERQLIRFFFQAVARLFEIEDPTPIPSPDNLRTDAVEQAKHYILFRYHRDTLSVREVADHVKLTPSHLAHLFRLKGEPTIRQTIVETRLGKAWKLLEQGRRTVKEVSHMTGWSSQLYFSRRFRERFGIPPSEVGKRG